MEVQSYFGDSNLRATIAAGSVLLLTIYVLKKRTGKKNTLPPGPRPWPIVGNLLDFSGKVDSTAVFDCYRKIHGDIYTLYFGSTPFIVLNGYELIKEAFITKANDFAGRYSSYSVEITSRGGKSIFAGQFNSVWQVQRKVVHGAMRKYATGAHLEEKLQDSIRTISEHILQRAKDGPLDPLHVMTLLVYNIICSIAFGKKYDEDDEEFKAIVNAINTANTELGDGLLADYFPFLSFLPTPGSRKLKRIVTEIQEIIKKKWDEHNATFDPNCVSDLTYHIIKEREELKESQEDGQALSLLTEDHYLELLSDFFFAGTDTSRYTLTWVILYLAAHPECQKKMQKEIDNAIGSREIKISDRPRLPYTEAVLHEVMRLRPLAPLLFPHTTTCDTSVGGYIIPHKTPVMANVLSLHMDPKSYPEPHKFQPERFLDESGNFKVRPGEWMPFSAGRRVCVGESVAKVELHLLTAMLVQKFSFSPAEGKTINLECQELALSMFPVDQKVTMKPRN